MKNRLVSIPCEPGDLIYIKSIKKEARVIKIEITRTGMCVIAINKNGKYRFTEPELGRSYIIV